MSELAHRFTADVLGARPVLRDRKRFDAVLAGLDGCEVEILIRKARKRRSLPQNAMLHALARGIAAHTGEELWKVKARAVLSVLGLEDGLVSFTFNGSDFVRPKSTADLTRAEGARVIDWLLDTSADLGVPPPDPEKVGVF